MSKLNEKSGNAKGNAINSEAKELELRNEANEVELRKLRELLRKSEEEKAALLVVNESLKKRKGSSNASKKVTRIEVIGGILFGEFVKEPLERLNDESLIKLSDSKYRELYPEKEENLKESKALLRSALNALKGYNKAKLVFESGESNESPELNEFGEVDTPSDV
jgi:hypothetical protein